MQPRIQREKKKKESKIARRDKSIPEHAEKKNDGCGGMKMFTRHKLNDSTELCHLKYKIPASASILHSVWQACICWILLPQAFWRFCVTLIQESLAVLLKTACMAETNSDKKHPDRAFIFLYTV